MGMDLISRNRAVVSTFNWAGWDWMVETLIKHNVSPSMLERHNDGDLISPKDCMKIAKVLRNEADEIERAGSPSDIVEEPSELLLLLMKAAPEKYGPETREKQVNRIKKYADEFEAAVWDGGFEQW